MEREQTSDIELSEIFGASYEECKPYIGEIHLEIKGLDLGQREERFVLTFYYALNDPNKERMKTPQGAYRIYKLIEKHGESWLHF